MREILFRGKAAEDEEFFNVKQGQWLYGSLFIDEFNNQVFIENSKQEDIITIDVNPETVGQYTGLKDKNGTKIYEGDIVRIENNDNYIRYIVYSGVRCSFITMKYCDQLESHEMCRLGEYSEHEIEVIGNIHDNPELLGGVKSGTLACYCSYCSCRRCRYCNRIFDT